MAPDVKVSLRNNTIEIQNLKHVKVCNDNVDSQQNVICLSTQGYWICLYVYSEQNTKVNSNERNK